MAETAPSTPAPRRHSTLLNSPSDHQRNLVDLPIEPMIAEAEQSARREVRLNILDDDVLCLESVPARPPWLSRLTYLIFLGCLVVMIYLGLQGILLGMERQKNDSIIMWACFTALPTLILLATLVYPFFKPNPLQFYFDRRSRLMTVQRSYGFSKKTKLLATYNLDDVVALQLMFRYYKAVTAGIAMSRLKKQSYEMNLVFRNVNPARVNLAVHSDWRWTQQAGTRLAEFLEIPVADQLCQGEK